MKRLFEKINPLSMKAIFTISLFAFMILFCNNMIAQKGSIQTDTATKVVNEDGDLTMTKHGANTWTVNFKGEVIECTESYKDINSVHLVNAGSTFGINLWEYTISVLHNGNRFNYKIGTATADPINIGADQCSLEETKKLNKAVNRNLIQLKSTLINRYEGDWFALLKDERAIADSMKQKITDLRFDLVDALTCNVQQAVAQMEMQARQDLANPSEFSAIKYIHPKVSGSQSFASDIDVALKGDGTEFGVMLINKNFNDLIDKNHEMGELLDINFYAKDFLPASTGDLRIEKSDYDKYIAASTWKEYPITDKAVQEEDIKFQTVMSIAFMIKMMQEQDLRAFEARKSIPDHIVQSALAEYQNYEDRLNEFSAVGSEMTISNRAYEKILREAAKKRVAFEYSVIAKDPSHEKKYLEWKKYMTYSNLHANEAHCTEGAIIHVVVNKQILNQQFNEDRKGLKKLELTEHELYHSFNEQIGFAFAKLDHTDSNLSLVKVGKYVHRAYNALKQFYRKTAIDPVYTEAERSAATDWEGLKKGLKRDANGLFSIKVIDSDDLLDELDRILDVFEKRMKEEGIVQSLGTDVESRKVALKKYLMKLKVTIDQLYFEKNKSIYDKITTSVANCQNIDYESTLLSNIFKLQNYTNGYHGGRFTKMSNGNLLWENQAGVSWELKPDYNNGYLDATVGSNYYKNDENGKKFMLLTDDDCNFLGFEFMESEYLLKGSPILFSKLWDQLKTSTYRVKDYKNKWQGGHFTELENNNLQWTNDAGESWLAKPNFSKNEIDVDTSSNPYKDQKGGKAFHVIVENGNLKGFSFKGDLYLVQ